MKPKANTLIVFLQIYVDSTPQYVREENGTGTLNFSVVSFFNIGIHFVDKADVKLTEICMPLIPECWD